MSLGQERCNNLQARLELLRKLRIIGEEIATREAPEKARKAVEEAVETGQELPVGRGYGADAFNRSSKCIFIYNRP